MVLGPAMSGAQRRTGMERELEAYVITGGAGFIGSHLADALLAAGHRVRVLDDFSTGRIEISTGDAR